jgi:circadian clock protein KaiB
MADNENEAFSADNDGETWQLRLYIAGQTPKSLEALANLRRICEEHLKGRYKIEVVDLTRNPKVAREHQIVAVPTLVRQLPPPLRKIIGTLADEERVLVGLDITPHAEA